MKRTIYLTITSIFWTLSAMAQEPRQVVVTRDYQPDVSTFQKLDFAPRELDTTALQPDMEYAIAPVLLVPDAPLHIAQTPQVDLTQRALRYPFYVRAGGGAFPLRSLLDIYATTGGGKKPVLGAYLNHDGAYSSPRNDAGENRSSMTMHNDLGGYYSQKFGKNNLNASLNYSHNFYEPYGQFTPQNIATETAPVHTLQYGDLSAKIAYAGYSKAFSYSVAGSGGYFFSADGASLGYADLNGSVTFNVGVGELNIGLPISYEGGVRSDFRVGVVPTYRFRLLDRFNINAGAQVLYNNHRGLANHLYFYPIVEADMMVDDGLKLSVSWTGDLEHGTTRALVVQNPYVDASAIFAQNPSVNRLRANLTGNMAQMLTYDIYGGADIWRNYTYFVAHPSGLFTANSAEIVNNYYIGAAVAVQPFAGFEISVSGRYNFFDPMPETGTAIPRWKAGIKAQYSYQNCFYARISTDFLGERRFATADDASGLGIDVIPISIDLSAEFEARISRSINVFVRGENLLNKRFELYDHYFIPGLSIMAGVKIVF